MGQQDLIPLLCDYGACPILPFELLCTRPIVNQKGVIIFRKPTNKEKIMTSLERKMIVAEKPS